MTGTQQLIDQTWDFNDPAASEARFRAAMNRAADPAPRLELQTQLARAQGLQRNFHGAHATLDEVREAIAARGDHAAPAPSDVAMARVRHLLERGRVFNSSNQRDKALPLLENAFVAAQEINNHHLAIDAAHMIAIVHGAERQNDQAMQWNRRALQIAESSDQPRARQWRGSLHNNIGWTRHDQGDFAVALEHFQNALACRIEQINPRDIRTARWCVARCLRSLGRVEEALDLQRGLLEQIRSSGEEDDGFIHEEIGECLLRLDRAAEAAPYFTTAHRLLSRDASLAAQQPERLRRLLVLTHPAK